MTNREHVRNLILLGAFALALALVFPGMNLYLRSLVMLTKMYVVQARSRNKISGLNG